MNGTHNCGLYIWCVFCSSPAPGHFNNDDVLDIMLHFNYGEWPSFTYSKVRFAFTRNTIKMIIANPPTLVYNILVL